jgi:NADH-quinone oxidoreductase subunit N
VGPLSAADLVALLPLEALAAASVAVPLVIAVRRSHAAVMITAAVALLAGLATLPLAAAGGPRDVGGLLMVDGMALLYIALILVTALVIVLLSYGYLQSRDVAREEYYALVPLATLGAGVLAAASHFATFFLGLELLTVGLLVLIAYHRTQALTLEAGLKYLVLAGVSSASVLMGLGLLYFELGTMDLAAIAGSAGRWDVLSWAGVLLVVTGIGFKLALVPFHLWTPDVFQGSSMPVAAYVATVSKTSVVALVLRALEPAAGTPTLTLVLTVLALATMLVGNLLALAQTNLKRLLGFSSVAHMGYLLVAFVAGGQDGPAVATFYLWVYCLTSLAVFGALTVLSSGAGGSETDEIEGLRGLSRSRPALAGVLAVGLLSLAGLPPTAGFLGKLYLIGVGVQTGQWLLLAALLATSVIGVVYYLRVVIVVFRASDEEAAAAAATPGHAPVLAGGVATAVASVLGSGRAAERVLLVAVTAAVVAIGVYPGPLIDWIGRLMGLVG